METTMDEIRSIYLDLINLASRVSDLSKKDVAMTEEVDLFIQGEIFDMPRCRRAMRLRNHFVSLMDVAKGLGEEFDGK